MILLAPAVLSAQSRSFRTLYDKYAGSEGYVTVEMSGSMFNVVNGVAKDNNRGSSDFMSKIDNLVIIVADTDDPAFGRDVEAMVRDGGYISMTTVRDGGDKVQFYAIQKDGKASEFMITVISDSEYVVMSITGDGLSVDEISQIARKTGNAIILED
jgi:TusA-related sulfurtransferase